MPYSEIVQLLAKGADDHRRSPAEKNVVYKNIYALIDHASDEFVRQFLARVMDVRDVLTLNVTARLFKYL